MLDGDFDREKAKKDPCFGIFKWEIPQNSVKLDFFF